MSWRQCNTFESITWWIVPYSSARYPRRYFSRDVSASTSSRHRNIYLAKHRMIATLMSPWRNVQYLLVIREGASWDHTIPITAGCRLT